MPDPIDRLGQCRTMLAALRQELANIPLDTDNAVALHHYAHTQAKLGGANEHIGLLLAILKPTT